MYKILTLSEEYIPVEDLDLKVRRDAPALITQEQKDGSQCLAVLVGQRKVHVQPTRPPRKKVRRVPSRTVTPRPAQAGPPRSEPPEPPKLDERVGGMEQDLSQVLRVLNRTVSDLAEARSDLRNARREISTLKGRVTRLQKNFRGSVRGEKTRRKYAGRLQGEGEE